MSTFTTVAVATALEETPVSYEDLADIEREFDDAETEIIRQQVALTAPLYTRRSKLVSQIDNFWPLVLEQAPPDIDQYIHPIDSLLLSSLTSLSVSHFEIGLPEGDPRSVALRWEFSENDHFTDKVLEKKFWYRRSKHGWSGLVSEPVRIAWRYNCDVTGGLLDLACKAWSVEKGSSRSPESTGLSPEQKALKKKIDNTGRGGLSFFAWFGFIGRKISAEESREATRVEQQRREERKEGKSLPHSTGGEEEADEGEDELDMSLEIFPDGDDLAVAITEDLWPGAIKYFTQAQELDALSDADFESDDGQSEECEDEADRPAKKHRSA